MKYKPDIQLENGNWFKHGDNLIGKHVDCIGRMEQDNMYDVGYFHFKKKATKKEIEDNCLE